MDATIECTELVVGTSDVSRALTWTLAHSIWVGACAALCLGALLYLLPARRARWRYAACLAAFASVPLVAIWTLVRELQGSSELPSLFSSSIAHGSALENSFAALRVWADGLRLRLGCLLAPWETWIAVGWTVLAALAFARTLGGWALLQFDSTYRLERAAPSLQARVARLARRIGLRRRVPLYWSERAEGPMVIGALRPRIVVPARLEIAVERGELDLVLLHELAHVRRKDAWARSGEAVIQALFAFHPALPWIVSRVAREREHCCDDVALAAGADRLSYLRALAALESARTAQRALKRRSRVQRLASVPALHSTDGTLLERVRRLTAQAHGASRSRRFASCAVLVLGSAGLAVAALPTHAGGAILVVGGEWAPSEMRAVAHLAPFELEWTGEPPPELDQLVDIRRRGRMVVLARKGAALESQPAGVWISDDGERPRVRIFEASDDEPRAVKKLIRFETIRTSR